MEIDNEDAMGCVGCLGMLFLVFCAVAVIHFVVKFW